MSRLDKLEVANAIGGVLALAVCAVVWCTHVTPSTAALAIAAEVQDAAPCAASDLRWRMTKVIAGEPGRWSSSGLRTYVVADDRPCVAYLVGRPTDPSAVMSGAVRRNWEPLFHAGLDLRWVRWRAYPFSWEAWDRTGHGPPMLVRLDLVPASWEASGMGDEPWWPTPPKPTPPWFDVGLGQYPALPIGGCARGDSLVSTAEFSLHRDPGPSDWHWYGVCARGRDVAGLIKCTDGGDGSHAVMVLSPSAVTCTYADRPWDGRELWARAALLQVDGGARRVRAWLGAALVFVGGQRAAGWQWTYRGPHVPDWCVGSASWATMQCEGERERLWPEVLPLVLVDPFRGGVTWRRVDPWPDGWRR